MGDISDYIVWPNWNLLFISDNNDILKICNDNNIFLTLKDKFLFLDFNSLLAVHIDMLKVIPDNIDTILHSDKLRFLNK